MKKFLPFKISLSFFVILCTISSLVHAQYLSQCYNNSNFSNYQPSVSLAVGAVDGSHSVSATGAASYNIPIAVPPGTYGTAPSLQIAYNSQGGDGPLGIGWSIGGLSAISRTGSDHYHEQAVTPVSFNSNDRFALDGTRLVGTNGTYGANLATYSTESQNYATVTSYIVNGPGPDWFQVVKKDGTIMEYGNTADSKFTGGTSGVISWFLDKIQDINGNYITFSYTQNNGEVLVDEIKYTGNDNVSPILQPYNKIKFNYNLPRNDNNTAYIAGYSMNLSHLLSSIIITGENNASFKTYNFNYGFDGVRSYLQEVIEKGSQGGQLNKTIFKYGENQLSQMDVSTVTLPNYISVSSNTNQFFAGDFNGDGQSDILISNQSVQGYTINFTVDIGGLAVYNSPPLSWTTVANNRGRLLDNFYSTDFNGDKLDDIVTSTLTNGTDNVLSYLTIYISSYLNNQYSATPHQIFAPPTPYNIIGNPSFLQFGDFDGDGRTDILVTLGRNNTNNWKSYIWLSGLNFNYYNLNFYSSWLEVNTSNLPSTAPPDQIHVLDFDGDGKSDILFIQDQTIQTSCQLIHRLTFITYAKTFYPSEIAISHHKN